MVTAFTKMCMMDSPHDGMTLQCQCFVAIRGLLTMPKSDWSESIGAKGTFFYYYVFDSIATAYTQALVSGMVGTPHKTNNK